MQRGAVIKLSERGLKCSHWLAARQVNKQARTRKDTQKGGAIIINERSGRLLLLYQSA